MIYTLRAKLYLAFSLLCLALVLPVFSPPQKAAAAGEEYMWTVNSTIRVSGGDLSAPGELTFVSEQNGQNVFEGTLQHASGCSIAMQVNWPLGDAQFTTSVSGGSCNQAIKQGYDNQTITNIVEEDPNTSGENRGNVAIKFWGPDAIPKQGGPSTATPSPDRVDFEILRDDSAVFQSYANKTTTDVPLGSTIYTMGYYELNSGGNLGNLPSLERGAIYKMCPTSTTVISCITFTVPTDYVSGDVLEINRHPTPLDTDDICDAEPGPLNFLVCPIIEITASTAQKLDCIVLNLLIIDTDPIFGGNQGSLDNNPSTLQCLRDAGASIGDNNSPPGGGNAQSSNAFRTAWGLFRTISFALIVILGLAMIVSQIMGLDIFDAYTIKKMLPKLIVAVIAISLSWNIMNFLFNLSNDAAFALMEVIKGPFSDLNAADGTGISDMALSYLLPLLLVAAGAVGAGLLAILGVGGGAALLVSVLLAVFSAFMVLTGRNVAAYLLIIAAPLAIACSAFEPFKRLFTLWRTLLTGILLSVPAVAAVIAASHVGSLVAYLSNTTLSTFIAVVILVVGYLLAWPTLKKMDQVAGQLDGFAGRATGGIQKALAGFRSNQRKQNWGLFKQGALNTRFGRRFGGIGERIGAAQAVGKATGSGFMRQLLGRGEVAGQRLANYRGAVGAERAKDAILAAGAARAQDDTVNALIVEGLNEDQIVRRHIALHGLHGNAQEVEEADIRRRVRLAEGNLGGSVGQAQTRLLAWRSLQASGSAFRATPNEYGNDWHRASEALYQAGASLVHDGLLGTDMDMAGDIKGFKRHDHRGASFGAVAGQAQASIAAYDAQLQNNGDRSMIGVTQAGNVQAGAVMTDAGYTGVTDSAIQNVSGPVMAQERDETADRYAQRILFQARDADGNPTGPATGLLPEIVGSYTAAQQQLQNIQQQFPNAQPGTPGYQQVQAAQRDVDTRQRNFYQLIAQVADFRDYQAGASRGVAAELADLMETALPGNIVQIPGAPAVLPGGGTVEQYIREIQNMYNAGVALPDQFAAMRREASDFGNPYAQMPPGQPQGTGQPILYTPQQAQQLGVSVYGAPIPGANPLPGAIPQPQPGQPPQPGQGGPGQAQPPPPPPPPFIPPPPPPPPAP